MKPFSLVAIGASLGGLQALQVLLKGLPADFPWPVAVVLHRDPESDMGVIQQFLKDCPLKVKEAEDKEPTAACGVYFAPAGYHLLVEAEGRFALSTDEPVQHARPAIDALFESVADACGKQGVGIVLTGSNQDGAAGARRIAQAGGVVVVQEPGTARDARMPAAAIEATQTRHIMPLEKIAEFLISLKAES